MSAERARPRILPHGSRHKTAPDYNHALVPRPALRPLALLFSFVSVLYGGTLMYYIHRQAGSTPAGVFLSFSEVALQLVPLIFLGVGLTVLWLRLTDPFAWLTAGLFACFLTAQVFPVRVSELPASLARFVLAYRAIAVPAIPTLFYAFFARFPTRSPIDRALPWLNWLNVAGWILFSLPNVRTGIPSLPDFLEGGRGEPVLQALRLGYLLAGIPLGIVALTWNALKAPVDARRKARVLLSGTVAGAVPILLTSFVQLVGGRQPPAWTITVAVLMTSLLPVSFAYAVVRHRVLDIPVLIKRSARYLLVRRGFGVLLVVMAATLTSLFTLSLSTLLEMSTSTATTAGVMFGVLMSVGSAPLVRRATTRIDRAFFRSAYDATSILENLAEQIRSAKSRQALANLLEAQITEALHPVSLGVFLEDADGKLHPFAERWSFPMRVVDPDVPWLQELARLARPWDVSSSSKEQPPAFLTRSEAELLVPMTGEGGRLTGFVVLGSRVSEEPYSGDDKRLLMSVANQAGGQLENIRFAEAMAEHLDAQRTAARELEIARQVQFRLFPQKQPPLETMEYAGGCVQALQVGGDYYDFVNLGPGRVGFVVADIAGKGMAGALLMANLQANLRSQYMVAADDLSRLLRSVNQLFYDNTADNQYATLFFADYSDDHRRLRYANCGHLPPYLFHADGTVEPLMPTAMVVGLFEEWTVKICDRELRTGDTLVLYTDGVTEATNEQLDEFGSERLIATVNAHRDLPAAAIVNEIHAAVQDFSHGHPTDDLTVVVAHVR